MGKPHATDARRAGWHADTGASTDTVMGASASTNPCADLGADGCSGTSSDGRARPDARASTIAGGHADARSRANARLGTDSNSGTCADACANTGPRPGTRRITRGTGPCGDWNRY